MGVQHTYGTAGATGGGFATLQTLQPAYQELTGEPRWSWQNRSPRTRGDTTWYRNLWSWGCRVGGGDDLSYAGHGAEIGHGFEPFSCDGPGNQSLKFIKGVCRDVSNNPLAGVNVESFRTSDDQTSGLSVQSRADGSYDCPTIFGAVPHYVRAYLAGSPDRAGTSVNTLTPTNVDGT